MGHVLLLDSNVWSHLILSDIPKREKLLSQLVELRQKYPGAVIATSGICVAECLVAARRLADVSEALQVEAMFKSQFEAPGVVVVPVNEQVLDRASSLRAQRLKLAASRGSQSAGMKGGRLQLPDAIVAASCLDFKPTAVLVTENVADFRYIEDGIQRTVAGLIVEQV